ncbi:MAG: sigma-E factor negative regulatory protein [Gammaproteobacteria bacterium]|jgi:sigma-E factor negative regulatory protein RseA
MQIDEQTLSSVMDGEAATGEALAGVASTSATRAAWARYHLIGDVLRDNSSEVAPMEFAATIAAQIAEEPTVLAPRRSAKRALRPVAGFAIAASVAALAVIGVQRMDPSPAPGAAPAIAAAPGADRIPATTFAEPAQMTVVAESAGAATPAPLELSRDTQPAQRRFNSYLVKFNEQRSNVGVPGVNPYVRIVGFESE